MITWSCPCTPDAPEHHHGFDGYAVPVKEPDVYDAMPEDVYFADPVPDELGRSLSQSGAKLLLPPSTPAHFHADREHASTASEAQKIGTAVHTRVLGVGQQVVRTEFTDWRTKAAKAEKARIEAEGHIALRAQDEDPIGEMAEAVLAHKLGRILFEQEGRAEQSLFCPDPRTGVWRRARFDLLPETTSGRMLIPDLKSSVSANPRAFPRQVENYRYYLQAHWYPRIAEDLELATEASLLFVVVEKTRPYPVSVIELDPPALEQAREESEVALATYAECQGTGVWPAYPHTADRVVRVSLKPWFYRDRAEELVS